MAITINTFRPAQYRGRQRRLQPKAQPTLDLQVTWLLRPLWLRTNSLSLHSVGALLTSLGWEDTKTNLPQIILSLLEAGGGLRVRPGRTVFGQMDSNRIMPEEAPPTTPKDIFNTGIAFHQQAVGTMRRIFILPIPTVTS